MQVSEKYVRFAKGLVRQFNEMIPAQENPIKKSVLRKKQDYYVSLYQYSKEHFENFKKTHSVAGITDVKTPKLLWDFDSQDINQAKKDALILCDRLIKAGINETKIRTYFSGNKGFHVELYTDQEFTRSEFCNIVFTLAQDLSSFDTRINDEARIIRVPLTQHADTGLYKIPLELSELAVMSVEDIMEQAKDVSVYDETALDDDKYVTSLPAGLLELKNTTPSLEKPKIDSTLTFSPSEFDLSRCPKWLSPERYALQEGFFYGSDSQDVGERNTAFMILAATYRAQGFSREHSLSLLLTTAEKQAGRTGETPWSEDELERQVISAVYSPHWRGGIFGKDEPLLAKTRERFNILELPEINDLVDIGTVGGEFKWFAKEIDRNTIKTGIQSLDSSVIITSGMMVSLLAAPGAGKTSFSNLFVEHLSRQGENTLFFSLDMYQNLMFSRLLQKYSGYDMNRILNMFKEDNPDDTLRQAYAEVISNFSNVMFNFKTGLTIEDIEEGIIDYQKTSGKPIKLVVIDYLEKVRGPFADATANSAYIASRISDLAKKYHLTILLLVQPNKMAGDPRDDLNTYRKIKGSSTIEQDSRVVLTLSRPGYDPGDMSRDKFACISVVKNNMGPLCKLDYYWDGVSGNFMELDPEGRRELKNLREELEDAKKDLPNID